MNNIESMLVRFAREDLLCYGIAQYPHFQVAAHHRLYAEGLEALERGEDYHLVTCMPPRHGKSTWTTELLVA